MNSGVANAATGERGLADALSTASEAARVLDLRPEQVVVLSTGVIGVPLPLEKVLGGVRAAAAALAPDGGAAAAEAILTTDSGPKESAVACDGFTVGGMAKGAGMIHPRLATMLAVVTTDFPLLPGEADDFLRPAVDATFNRISVDGDCSTNDAVVLLANGAATYDETPLAKPRLQPHCVRSAPISHVRSWRTARERRYSSRSASPVPPPTTKRWRSREGSQPRRS